MFHMTVEFARLQRKAFLFGCLEKSLVVFLSYFCFYVFYFPS